MSSNPIPQEIGIIIINGTNLIGRKSGLRSFSCVFGIGNKKFTTASDPVSDGNPKWNEEALISVKMDCKDKLVFKILDNSKKIGKLEIPLDEIPGDQIYSLKILPIKPSKNFPNCSGEITFKCWVSKTYSGLMPEKTRRLKSITSLIGRKASRSGSKFSIDGSSIQTRFESMPTIEIGTVKTIEKIRANEKDTKLNSLTETVNSSGFGGSKQDCSASMTEEDLKNTDSMSGSIIEFPRVTSIKPKIIRGDKREKISIHGRNFGSSIEDILDVELGGKSIFSNVTFHSSTLLFATIDANMLDPVEGLEIIVTSKMNGKGTCGSTLMVQNKRQSIKERDRKASKKIRETLDLPDVAESVIQEETGRSVKKSNQARLNPFSVPVDNQVSELREKIENLNVKNNELIVENDSLKKDFESLKARYDQLLIKVMMQCPDILEVL